MRFVQLPRLQISVRDVYSRPVTRLIGFSAMEDVRNGSTVFVFVSPPLKLANANIFANPAGKILRVQCILFSFDVKIEECLVLWMLIIFTSAS